MTSDLAEGCYSAVFKKPGYYDEIIEDFNVREGPEAGFAVFR